MEYFIYILFFGIGAIPAYLYGYTSGRTEEKHLMYKMAQEEYARYEQQIKFPQRPLPPSSVIKNDFCSCKAPSMGFALVWDEFLKWKKGNKE